MIQSVLISDAKIARRADGKITPMREFCTRFTDFAKDGVGGERRKAYLCPRIKNE